MTNHIERMITLDAPIERVWRALTDAEEFGTWFRVALTSPFEVGKVTRGAMTYPGHEGTPFWARVERMDAPHTFSFTWPMDETVAPNDPDLAYKVTRVDFALTPAGSGTRVTIRESGFDHLPNAKRVQLFRDNQGGWEAQSGNLADYLS